MKKLLVPAALVCLLGVAAAARAQEHYIEGPVWRVTYLNVKPGKFNDAMKDLRANFNKVMAAAKAQGTILDYKVFLNATSTGPTDWNIATAVLYRGYAGLDGLAAKMEALTLSHYGTADARAQAGDKRLELWTVTSSVLGREITLR